MGKFAWMRSNLASSNSISDMLEHVCGEDIAARQPLFCRVAVKWLESILSMGDLEIDSKGLPFPVTVDALLPLIGSFHEGWGLREKYIDISPDLK